MRNVMGLWQERSAGRSSTARRVGAVAIPLTLVGLWASNLQAGAVDIALPPIPPPTPPALGVPTPTPSPVPTPSLGIPAPPAPLPGAPPAIPAPGASAAPPASAPASPAAAPSAAPAPAGPAVVADSLLAHLTFADPFLSAQIGAILANPLTSQQPDLRHLSFVAGQPGVAAAGGSASTAAAPTGAGAAARRVVAGLLLVVAALALLLLAALSPLPLARRWRASIRQAERADRLHLLLAPGQRLRWGLATALPVVALVAGIGGVRELTRPATPHLALAGAPHRVTLPAGTVAALDIRSGAAPRTAGPAAAGPAGASDNVPGPAAPAAALVKPAPPAVLVELRRVEERIGNSHTRVAAAESRVAQLSAAPLSQKNPSGQARTLRAAVADREEALAAYNTALASEYTFYRGMASDSGRSEALVAAVQTLGRPDLRESVVYDLQVVRTQIAEEAALAAVAATSPDTGAAITALPATSGTGLLAPFTGVLTQTFGPSTLGLEAPLVYQGVFYAHFHTGCDFAAPQDTPVAAGATGVVVFAGQSLNSAGQLVGYGNYVVVAHANGYQTLYGHLDRIAVRPGQTVTAGQPLGLEGSTGWSTGPHTHFELRHLGEPVDPMPFLNGRPLS